jgi:hypothetical protein
LRLGILLLVELLPLLLDTFVELDADKQIEKKPFKFMQSGVAKGFSNDTNENMTVKKEAKSHPFLEPLLKITKHKL